MLIRQPYHCLFYYPARQSPAKGTLKMYPYSDAPAIAEGVEAPVDVISVMLNREGEAWALVELIPPVNLGINTYGYVKVDYIEEAREDTFDSIPVSINEITVGDPVEKVIALFGRDYVEYNGYDGGFIHYGGVGQTNTGYYNLPGVDVFIDRESKRVYGIRVKKEGYKTEAGFEVGSNAWEAVNYYKRHFRMNTGKQIDPGLAETAFDLGNGYFLEFEIDTEALSPDSTITQINIFPVNFIYG